MPIPLRLAKLLIRLGVAQRLPAVRALLRGGTEYLHYFSDRVLMSPNTEILETQRHLASRMAGTIDLCVGAPQLPQLWKPLWEAVEGGVEAGYPPATGLAELRECVAAKLAAENGVAVSPADEITIVNGVHQAIALVFDTFVSAGDRVVLLDPSFLVYGLALQSHRARVRYVPTEVVEGETRLDWDALERALGGAKLLVLNSPGNPTGGVLGRETLERILSRAERHDVLVFSDEVYERFQYQGRHVSPASLAGAGRRTLTASSLSKSHGMAGFRVGFLAGNRHLLAPVVANQFLGTPFVPGVCQRLAIGAYRQRAGLFVPVLQEFRRRRDWMQRELCELGLACPLPGGAFYLWCSVAATGLSGRQFAERLLAEKQVLVMPGEHFGPSGRDKIRVSYVGAEEQLVEGYRRLRGFVRELRGSAGERHTAWLRGPHRRRRRQKAESRRQNAEGRRQETAARDCGA